MYSERKLSLLILVSLCIIFVLLKVLLVEDIVENNLFIHICIHQEVSLEAF